MAAKFNTHYEEVTDYRHAKKLPAATPKFQKIADASKARGQDRTPPRRLGQLTTTTERRHRP